MSGGALGEKTRLARFVAAEGARVAWRRFAALTTAPFRAAGRTPDKLVIAPQDLRTSDPTRAGEIYAGLYVFAGKTVDVRGGSPFQSDAPSDGWAEALHGFGWLRHLRAADTTLARANARALVDEWIGLRGGRHAAVARAPHVAARRLIAWLCHSPLILDGADRAFYRRFLRSLARQTRQLGRLRAVADDGLPRLAADCALTYAGLCLAGENRLLKTAARQLAEELDRQILADGGHVGRNPAALVEILLDLLPLRQAFAVRGVAPPQALLNAIDRAMPMLRFFRHGDGDFVQFNGAGPAQGDLIATVLAYDDARGAPLEDAPHSGYQRVAAGEALLVADVGAPPPPPLSATAHAGALAFEFSSGTEQIIVNCGVPRHGRERWDASRATAAHSTAVIDDTSSCRFARSPLLRRLIGPLILAGPRAPTSRRERDDGGVRLVASHDGYRARFGLWHDRSLRLSADGDRLDGEDAFRTAEGAKTPEAKVALRFHLHPSVRASVTQDGQGVVLALASGAGWLFAAVDATAELEESVHLSGAHGPRRTEQIVIRAPLRGAPKIAWSLRRLETGAGASRRARLPSSGDGPTLL
ncbi:heparinase II/III family protein [Methylopila turkensis]|uniref:Heparinase n=1 Tax=Methylopila turkensis TaxID=1437816 RepID=A0A9W6JLC5_9HYPH|nr:heparinase II/III family protein [Methylopila turkensis]GLK79292.1 heparinase [Methylopila turkensis]